MIELRSITTSPGLGRLKRPNLNNLLNNLRDCPRDLTRRGDGEFVLIGTHCDLWYLIVTYLYLLVTIGNYLNLL